MVNKDVQQKLCTEPKSTVNETIQFAIAYQKGTMPQKSFDKLERPNIKSEGTEVNNIITSTTRNWGPTKKCFRCEGIFTPQHLKDCKAMGVTCMMCGKKGHFAESCQTEGAGAFAKNREVPKPPQEFNE